MVTVEGKDPESGYGWLAAVLPAHARRFRVADPALAEVLGDAGAELIDVEPDVEIAGVGQLRGDAPVSIAVLGRPGSGERSFAVRAARRLVSSVRVRLAARYARRAVHRLGYSTVLVFTWDQQQRLRNQATRRRTRSRVPLREYFPRRALIVGQRTPRGGSLLDAVLADANDLARVSLQADAPSIRTGVLIADAEQGILRVALGSGSRQIRNQRAALTALRASGAPELVADRVPWVLASGRCGLADWSLERRLRGSPATPSVTGRLLVDCVDFLVALHSARSAETPRSTLLEQVEIIVPAARREEARVLQALAEQLEATLADVPRGFVHGDFFHGNLLTEDGRLVGVIDWDAAGPGRLPLIDLLHLRHATHAVAERDWGPRLVDELLPWAVAGGDDIAQGYCERLGFSLDRRQLEAVVLAYWLDRLSSQLRSHAHRLAEPVWLARNISLVLSAVTERTRS